MIATTTVLELVRQRAERFLDAAIVSGSGITLVITHTITLKEGLELLLIGLNIVLVLWRLARLALGGKKEPDGPAE